jgi:hypothetical protein
VVYANLSGKGRSIHTYIATYFFRTHENALLLATVVRLFYAAYSLMEHRRVIAKLSFLWGLKAGEQYQ